MFAARLLSSCFSNSCILFILRVRNTGISFHLSWPKKRKIVNAFYFGSDTVFKIKNHKRAESGKTFLFFNKFAPEFGEIIFQDFEFKLYATIEDVKKLWTSISADK